MRKLVQLFTLFLLYFLILMILKVSYAGNGDIKTIPISIQATAEWEETTRNDNGDEIYRTLGSYLIMISGSMKMNPSGSPVVNKGGIMVMPVENYLPENLTATWIYEEEWEDLRPNDERQCSNPLLKRYQGYHSEQINIGPMLTINNFTSAMAPFMKNVTTKEKDYAAQFQGPKMPDFYQLSISGGNVTGEATNEITMAGIMLSSDCEYEDVEKRYPGFTIGLQMQLPPSGLMTGNSTWKSDCKGSFPPSFGMRVSDMTGLGGEEPFSPPEGGKQNVTYSIFWYIGVSPASPELTEANEDEEDDCEELQNRLNFISLMEAALNNTSLQKLAKNWSSDDNFNWKLFQNLTENAVMDAINTNDSFEGQLEDLQNADAQAYEAYAKDYAEANQTSWAEDPPSNNNNPFNEEENVSYNSDPDSEEGGANMKTSPQPNFEKNDYGSIIITDYCSGNPFVVEVYDSNGNLVYNGGVDASFSCWQEKYGNEAGEGLWKGAIEHERGHVKQYNDNNPKGGPTKNVDRFIKRELECYKIERQNIKHKMQELDC